eukprot:jgi/Mesvir1/9643/Mv25319-RA.1
MQTGFGGVRHRMTMTGKPAHARYPASPRFSGLEQNLFPKARNDRLLLAFPSQIRTSPGSERRARGQEPEMTWKRKQIRFPGISPIPSPQLTSSEVACPSKPVSFWPSN